MTVSFADRGCASFIGCATSFLLLLANPGVAQNSAVEGLGAQKCSVVAEAAQSDPTRYGAFGVWVSGFLTAANKYEESTYDLTPWQPPEYVMAQLAVACRGKPDATLAEVSVAYVGFLRDKRLSEQSQFVALRRDGKQMVLYLDVFEQIRSKLTDLGYDVPPITAQEGQAVLDVIADYQQDQGLAGNGLPDLETVSRLLN